MVEAADQMTDLQERYTAFANIEAWLNENAYYIPLYQSGGTYIVTSINEFTRPYAPTGIDEYKWKGIVGLDQKNMNSLEKSMEQADKQPMKKHSNITVNQIALKGQIKV